MKRIRWRLAALVAAMAAVMASCDMELSDEDERKAIADFATIKAGGTPLPIRGLVSANTKLGAQKNLDMTHGVKITFKFKGDTTAPKDWGTALMKTENTTLAAPNLESTAGNKWPDTPNLKNGAVYDFMKGDSAKEFTVRVGPAGGVKIYEGANLKVIYGVDEAADDSTVGAWVETFLNELKTKGATVRADNTWGNPPVAYKGSDFEMSDFNITALSAAEDFAGENPPAGAGSGAGAGTVTPPVVAALHDFGLYMTCDSGGGASGYTVSKITVDGTDITSSGGTATDATTGGTWTVPNSAAFTNTLANAKTANLPWVEVTGGAGVTHEVTFTAGAATGSKGFAPWNIGIWDETAGDNFACVFRSDGAFVDPPSAYKVGSGTGWGGGAAAGQPSGTWATDATAGTLFNAGFTIKVALTTSTITVTVKKTDGALVGTMVFGPKA